MTKVAKFFIFSCFFLSLAQNAKADDLDNYWAEVSHVVATGDFLGYSATYHPDAILVNGMKNTSYAIADALAGWKQGFDDTVAGTMSAGVEFRFTQTLRDQTTAHQTGIFHYYYTQNGVKNDSYIHFEALLINEGRWLSMMEYQKSPATLDEWQAAAPMK